MLYEHLDFDAFISSALVVEVQKQKPGYNILRRRIAILLGQWISIKVSEQSKPLVYEIFRHLLDNSDPLNDQVVRVTAGRQFKNIADEWEFKAVTFKPFAPDVLTRLMALIGEVELPETKMALLSTISSLVERLEHNVRIPASCDIYGELKLTTRRLPLTPTASSPYSHPCGSNLAKNTS